MIIDAHLHLDPTVDGTAMGAAKELDRQLTEAGIDHAIVLHLETQLWSVEDTAAAILEYPRLHGFINIHPYAKSAISQLYRGIDNLHYIGLKLHPRLQEFEINDDRTVSLVRAAGERDIPVLIDAFPDGTHLMQGFSAINYAMLAKKCPETRIIWAHMGGHYVLDFMMLAKRLPNVYMDLSYSLLYYQNSPTVDNMIYAMRSLNCDRIFYGSDYPDRPIDVSISSSIKIFKEKGLMNEEIEKIIKKNALDFFQWKDKTES